MDIRTIGPRKGEEVRRHFFKVYFIDRIKIFCYFCFRQFEA
jgi:hypothetical protein